MEKNVWRECHSSKYDRKYWFNEVSGESVWEDPTTSASAAAAGVAQQGEGRHDNTGDRGSTGKTTLTTDYADGNNVKRVKRDNNAEDGHASTASMVNTENGDIFEEPPFIAIERERKRDGLLTYLCAQNEKYGAMKGLSSYKS
jgi:hypothetical protein